MFEKITRSNYRFDSEDYYIDNKDSESLLLYERDKKNVRFFNPNSYDCLQCSQHQFRQMVKNRTLEKAKYLLKFSCWHDGYSDEAFYTSNELDKVYSQLKRIVRANISGEIKFTTCFMKDLDTKSQLLIANSITEVEQAIEKYKADQKNTAPEVKKGFKPSIINIQNLLASIGFKKNKSVDSLPRETQMKSKTR